MSQGFGPSNPLTFSAGQSAYREIQEFGLRPERIGTLAGASGGAKWLVLSQLDRAILRGLVPEFKGPVHTIGTSIGAWRFACYGQADPIAAIDRFEEAYLAQSYSESPDRAEITNKSVEVLDHVLGDSGVDEILANPLLRTHVMTVRARHIGASEHPALLATGLISAATLNALSRRTLGLFFDRVLFHDPRTDEATEPPFFSARGFPLHQVPLARNNLKQAVVATGSIPLVLEGVRDIPGAPPGIYRDGGVIDYHIDLPQSDAGRLVLFPHFYDYLKPGWFDKALSWRRPKQAHVDNTILISPSREFVSRLPHAKIPDRKDFTNFAPAERERIWREVVAACRELSDDLEDVLQNDRLAERIQLIPSLRGA